MMLPNGTEVPLSVGWGMQNQDMLSLSGYGIDNPMQPVSGEDKIAPPPKVSYLWYILGIFVLLVLMKVAGEHKSSNLNPQIMGVGVFNFVTVGVMAMLFMLLGKVLSTKYYVKGVSELFHAV